jgi:hypothetical protein
MLVPLIGAKIAGAVGATVSTYTLLAASVYVQAHVVYVLEK